MSSRKERRRARESSGIKTQHLSAAVRVEKLKADPNRYYNVCGQVISGSRFHEEILPNNARILPKDYKVDREPIILS